MSNTINFCVLDIGMAKRLGIIKINQIGTIGIRCYALSIPTISFYPQALGNFLLRLEVGYLRILHFLVFTTFCKICRKILNDAYVL